jgi:hypothetical protein
MAMLAFWHLGHRFTAFIGGLGECEAAVYCDTCALRLNLVSPSRATEQIVAGEEKVPEQIVSLRDFLGLVESKLQAVAAEKGYKGNGQADGSVLYDFVSNQVAGGTEAHAFGEIIYKTVEASKRVDLRENLMVKVAAWAFLAWDAIQRRKA